MLIESPRHAPEDLEAWRAQSLVDPVTVRSKRYRRAVSQAVEEVTRFAETPCYASVSWGKDSTVLAHLIAEHAPHVPLVWVRVEPIVNPDCELVRDVFLARYPSLDYHEITSWASQDEHGAWHASGSLERGLAEAVERFGARYITGIRAEESGPRKMRCAMHGLSTKHTCAPIGWWSGEFVFAYLYEHDLPIHPAYACLWGGLLKRERVRVTSLGGQRGTGFGRAEWEDRYYPEARGYR